MKTRSFVSALILSALVASDLAAAPAQQVWSTPLGADAKWHQLTSLGGLLIGTDQALMAITPEDGKIAWKRDDIKKSNRNNAREIPGTPILICNTYDGMMNSKVTFMAIDSQTGTTIWTAPQLLGQYHGTIPVPQKNLVIFVVNTMDQKDNGVYFMAHDLTTGAAKWSTKFTKAGGIPLHLADNSGRFIPTMDLSGYHDPVVDGDELYVGYLGVHCVDLTSGAVKWGVEFPAGNKGLKKTYAPLRIDGDRIYGGGGGSVYAIDRKTGTQLWKSDRISDFAGLFKARDNAIVAQLEIVGGKIFSRYGGNFSDGKTAALREPIGIVVLDPADGKSLYHFDKAKEGITNMAVLADGKTVVFADGANVLGLDAAAATPTETFRVPIEFKRKMGMGGVAKIGLGALGGVTGLAKGVMSANKGLLDVPVAVNLNGGRVIVQGKQHLLGFDPETKTSSWSLFYAAPSEALGNIAMFAVTAAAAVYGNAQAAAGGGFGTSGYNSGVTTIHTNLDNYNKYTEKAAARAGSSKASQAYTYILTKVEKDIGVVGVNLATGETDRELPLKDKEPEYMVDEPMNRVFHFKGKSTVVAYQF
ncbi:outer membrane protein assembly factor BamB family protein [Horticoccus sp. 23ND18S-11]|uniref:outer membrane protein assembly factor BamB family protein n=1 Tax=Horticoccus sp. 23ND18S-11 TaxID=3391832 RepID=UPI0039C8EAFD